MFPLDLSSISLPTWITIIAAFAACASAIVAYRNFRLTRKALDLSAKSAKLSNPSCSIYLIDAFRFRIDKTKTSLYVFCLSAENKSSIQNSITGAELRIPFVRDGIERIAVFRHSPNSDDIKSAGLLNMLPIPTSLSARGAIVATCCFEVPQELLKNAEYGPYCLRLTYAEGSATDIEARVIMDVINAEYLEQRRRRGVPI